MARILIYTKNVDAVEAFYCRHFNYQSRRLEGDRIVELIPQDMGLPIMLHTASKGQKEGQSLIKLIFDVPDVPAFCAAAQARGLTFGPVHQADGYAFANAKDPAKNSISVSSRAFRAEQPDDRS